MFDTIKSQTDGHYITVIGPLTGANEKSVNNLHVLLAFNLQHFVNTSPI